MSITSIVEIGGGGSSARTVLTMIGVYDRTGGHISREGCETVFSGIVGGLACGTGVASVRPQAGVRSRSPDDVVSGRLRENPP